VFMLQDEIKSHTHKITWEGHTHDLAEHEHDHEHPAQDLSHKHVAPVPVLVAHEHDPVTHEHRLPAHEHEGENISAAELAGQLAIDDAVLKHIKYDH